MALNFCCRNLHKFRKSYLGLSKSYNTECDEVSTTTTGDCKEDAESTQECLPEPQLITLPTVEEERKTLLQQCRIAICEPEDYTIISSIPAEMRSNIVARIRQRTKNAMQQGTMNLHGWFVDFNTKIRWENPLMGWCSTGDPLSNLQIPFGTKLEAINFCEKNNLTFWIQDKKLEKKFKVKSYSINFDHAKRTRVSTK